MTAEDDTNSPAKKAPTTAEPSAAADLFGLWQQQLTAIAAATASGLQGFTDVARTNAGLSQQSWQSMLTLLADLPAPAAQLDAFLTDLREKRALVSAVRAQLGAFEGQLEALEQSMRPVAEWISAASAARDALVGGLRAAEKNSAASNSTVPSSAVPNSTQPNSAQTNSTQPNSPGTAASNDIGGPAPSAPIARHD